MISLNTPSLAVFGAVVLFSASSALFGQTAATDPVGFTTQSLLANSDTFVSLPFTRPVAFTGAVSAISAANGSATISLSSSLGTTSYVYVAGSAPNTTTANHYYAIIGPMITALTGTVSLTNGSAAVTGTGTAFSSQLTVGDELLVNGLAYNVASISSSSPATALTLSRAYTGTTTTTPISATFDHSPREGAFYTVTANDSGSVTVSLNGDNLNAVALGTSVSLIPYWSIGTVFPATDAGTSFTVSNTAKDRGTQILLPDTTSAGFNLAPGAPYYFLNGAWQHVGADVSEIPNDAILPPSTYFIVRNAAVSTTFTPSGGVYMNRLLIPLDAQAADFQDTAVSVTRPAGTTLNDLGLISSGAFALSAGKQRGDLLFTYDPTMATINKSAGVIYYYDTAWHAVGDAATDYGSTVIPYGTGLTIRKIANGTGLTSFWQNTRNY